MLKILFVLLCTVASSFAFADTFWVSEAKGSGTSEADRSSVEELIRISLPRGQSVAKSRDTADWVLAPSLLKLGDAYILSLQKLNKAGQVVFSDKMKAATMSDMDGVASRLTQAVVKQVTVDKTADVTNITVDEETQNTRRYQATRQWVLGIGPGWASNVRSSGGGFTFLLGYAWGLDPDFDIDVTWLYNSGRQEDESTYSLFSLGGDYYFNRGKYSPFVGARLGYGTAVTNNNACSVFTPGCVQDRASGWGGTLVAGYKLFRTSTVNLAIIGTYSYVFERTSIGNPGLTAMQIAVYY